ncbi:MAG: sugar transferase [Planctomycetota bacterium]
MEDSTPRQPPAPARRRLDREPQTGQPVNKRGRAKSLEQSILGGDPIGDSIAGIGFDARDIDGFERVLASDGLNGSSKSGNGRLPRRLWGWTVVELHDLLWQTSRVAVIRRGSEVPKARDYLLLPDDALVLFDPDFVRRLRGSATLAAVVLDEVSEEDGPADMLRFDAEGVAHVRRLYRHTRFASGRVAITSSQRLAQTWAQSAEGSSVWRVLSRRARTQGIARITAKGKRFDATNHSEADQFVRELMLRGVEPSELVANLVEVRENLFAPSDARIDPRSSVYHQIWLGRGHSVTSENVLIGPIVLWDLPEWHQKPPLPMRDRPRRRVAGPLNASFNRKRRSLYHYVKRGIDAVGAVIGLAITLPFYPLIMLAIWLDDGSPFFFSHRRQGLDGKPFWCHKFRTMCKDADAIKQRIQEENESDGPQFHMAFDPRLTRVGRFLRAIDADEWPQLFNVLLGEMSFVGPRPSPAEENRCCPVWRDARLSVRPGITGLWQIRRTREEGLDFQEWIRFDLEYAKKIGPLTDLRILIETFFLTNKKILLTAASLPVKVVRRLSSRRAAT